MMAQRKTMPKLHSPCYDLEDVPSAQRDLSGSVVVRVKERADWMASLAEMLLLCNEAAARRIAKFGHKKLSDGTQTKPLGLEYIADRLDTDDPLNGFQVRSSDGWLQGFITTTTFTVWQRDFRWDSLAPESGISDEDLSERKWDSDNALAKELETQERDGDPDNEGIIWPKLAEISLLGGLGCGTWLLRLVLEELELEGKYEYVIVQATDNSVPFYENFGFIRVGAVAKYREKTPEQLAAISAAQAAMQKGAADKRNSKKRGARDSGEVEVNLPDWLKNKRFKFFVGGSGGAAAQEFFVFVDKEWEEQRGFRLYERYRDGSGSLKYREWRCAKELEPFDQGRQRFVPNTVRPASKLLPAANMYEVSVHRHRRDEKGKKPVDYVEIDREQTQVSAAYVQLNEAAARGTPEGGGSNGQLAYGKGGSKPQPREIDWNDHSDVNVARRRAAGFVPYCHWTFPEQSVEDICPSYMMARRLEKKAAGPGGVIETLRSRMRDTLPAKKRTRPEPPQQPVHTGHNYDDVSAESIKNSMYNKVVTVQDNRHQHDYYYVHHYILDMDWCHLVPMEAKSHFGGESFRAGRPRYKLVPEGEGRELDIPAARCQQVLAYAVSKTNNADKEVWDIVLPEEKEDYEQKLAEERRRQRQRQRGGADGGASGHGANDGSRSQRRQEAWEEAAMRVLRKLIRRKNSWPFLEPVDPVALNIPDYLEVVTTPMDLTTVKDKLSNGQYPSFAAWRADVELTFDNAILYNPAGNPVNEMAVEMKAVALEEMNKEEVKCGGGRPSLAPYGTPYSVDSPTASSPAASSVGPSSASHAAPGYGYLGDGPGAGPRIAPGETARGGDGEGKAELKQEAGLTSSAAIGGAAMQEAGMGGDEGGGSGSGRQSSMKGSKLGLVDLLR